MEQNNHYRNENLVITGLKIPFRQIFVLIGRIYAAVLLWSLLIGAIGGILFLIISLILGAVVGSRMIF